MATMPSATSCNIAATLCFSLQSVFFILSLPMLLIPTLNEIELTLNITPILCIALVSYTEGGRYKSAFYYLF